ncbi:MAG: heme-binding protein [Legionellaceae bacterium]|nr:heme-binding protein [Legionellaceae bacterium]
MINDNITKLNGISQKFIAATDEIWVVFNSIPKEVKLLTDFSNVLMKALQIFMIELLPSMQREIDHKKFYSASILCRSALDIMIQLGWILSLREEEQVEAINSFLNFDGVGTNKNGGKTYAWQDTVHPKYTARKIGKNIGFDEEVIETMLNTGESIKITTFDYLSRIAHWNPQIINQLIGLDANNHLVFNASEYERMALIASTRFITCAITFTLFFVDHFYPQMFEDVKIKMDRIQNKFLNSLLECNKDNLMQITIEKKCATYELASRLIQAAIEHAKTLDISICVAIVDPTGHLIAFAKMDDCCLIGIGTAQGKAYTAARSGLNTRDFLAYLNENEVNISSLQEEKLVIIAGGLPILYQGALIGGIGIGGGTGAQDEECAQHALKVLI